MLGQHGGNRDRLSYSFNLNESAAADHLLRGIDRFLDLADLHRHLAMFHTDRPFSRCGADGANAAGATASRSVSSNGCAKQTIGTSSFSRGTTQIPGGSPEQYLTTTPAPFLVGSGRRSAVRTARHRRRNKFRVRFANK
jgi:hypothetical protein